MTEKLMDHRSGMPWWEEEREYVACMIDALLWVVDDRSEKSIDPEDWSDAE